MLRPRRLWFALVGAGPPTAAAAEATNGSAVNDSDQRRRSRAWRFAAVAICLLAGLLLGTVRAFSHGEEIRNRSADLASLVSDAEDRVRVADARAAALQQDIDAAAGEDVSPKVEKVRADGDALRAAAGLTAVAGPGLRVELADAPRDSDGNYPLGVDPNNLVVHQQDVQSVVNALWAGGAEAMMIMDQRVVSTSAVRCIGNTLLLQGRTYSPPFVITAIGDPAGLNNGLAAEPGVVLFRQYVEKYQLVYEVETLNSVTLPPFDGLLRMTAAQQQPK